MKYYAFLLFKQHQLIFNLLSYIKIEIYIAVESTEKVKTQIPLKLMNFLMLQPAVNFSSAYAGRLDKIIQNSPYSSIYIFYDLVTGNLIHSLVQRNVKNWTVYPQMSCNCFSWVQKPCYYTKHWKHKSGQNTLVK